MLGIFLDSETSGLYSKKHDILEIAYKIIDVNTGAFLESFETIICITEEQWKKSDPESLKINGFTFEELQKGLPMQKVQKHITDCFDRLGIKRGGAVFICQNPSFDRAFFSQIVPADIQEAKRWPYHWLDLASMFWALSIKDRSVMPWDIGCSKDSIATHFGIGCEKKPHRAMNGTNHLIACYEALVGYPNQ